MSVFPKDFLWSASTAATQIEGSWNADGKGESIWDTLVHDGTGKIAHSENADVAIDFYGDFKKATMYSGSSLPNTLNGTISGVQIPQSGATRIFSK